MQNEYIIDCVIEFITHMKELVNLRIQARVYGCVWDCVWEQITDVMKHVE